MFTTYILVVYCLSFVVSSPIDSINNDKFIDGKQYTIKNVGVAYTQHVANSGECKIELNGKDEKKTTLIEGELVRIKNKWFKVEDCRLNRAYMVSCSSPLLSQMLNIVCSYVEPSYESKTSKQQQQVPYGLLSIRHKPYYNQCCESACTVNELIQYCPLKS